MQNGSVGRGAGPGQPLPDLTLAGMQAAYSTGLAPSQLVQTLYPAWAAAGPAFVTLAPLEDLLERARELEALPPSERGPLHGVPFGVKDNIDVAGCPTTAACEAFSYTPAASAPVVDQILAAGGIMVGKTNMDQFAAGLVGSRTPYGVARNAFDARFVPGGSSSGSGAVVGAGLLPFALGTDTAGSGRVPAMFNGCVGIKPTVGRLSTRGVVPAAKALDCVTVFAQNISDGAAVARIMEAAGGLSDPTWVPPGPAAARRFTPGSPFHFGVPGPQFLGFSGPGGAAAATGYEQLFADAIERLQVLGGTPVIVDFSAFAEIAAMLYGTSFVAARYAGIHDFLHSGPAASTAEASTATSPAASSKAGIYGTADVERTMSTDSDDSTATAGLPSKIMSAESQQTLSREQILADSRMERVTRAIIAGACGRTAVDLYREFTRLNELKARARVEMAKIDVLLVPTAAHHYTIAEVLEQETAPKVTWGYNANLGRFTNFVNLLDMAGIAIPSGILRQVVDDSDPAAASRRAHLAATGGPPQALPFGVTLLGPAWTDEYLWGLAAQFAEKTGLGNGPAGHGVAAA